MTQTTSAGFKLTACGIIRWSTLLLILTTGTNVFGIELRQIPDEYETSAGLGPALSNGGAASAQGEAAVRLNPGLLPLTKSYEISAGYHWPSAGREFFQASIVDSKTSPIAAGVSYTGYNDDYIYKDKAKNPSDPNTFLDSPVVRRGVVAFGQTFKTISLGVGATYVEANPVFSSDAHEEGQSRVKGVGLNLGVAGAISPALRYGISGENLTNQKIKEYTPKTYRAGISYALNPTIITSVDFKQRDRVVEFEAENTNLFAQDNEVDKLMEHPEQLVIGSFVARIQQYLQILGSYGQALSDARRTFGAGAAISGDHFSLSYLTTRPYMSRSASHQAVTLSVQVSM